MGIIYSNFSKVISFFMPMIIGVHVVKRLSVWFGIQILLLLILTNIVLIFKLVFDILN